MVTFRCRFFLPECRGAHSQDAGLTYRQQDQRDSSPSPLPHETLSLSRQFWMQYACMPCDRMAQPPWPLRYNVREGSGWAAVPRPSAVDGVSRTTNGLPGRLHYPIQIPRKNPQEMGVASFLAVAKAIQHRLSSLEGSFRQKLPGPCGYFFLPFAECSVDFNSSGFRMQDGRLIPSISLVRVLPS